MNSKVIVSHRLPGGYVRILFLLYGCILLSAPQLVAQDKSFQFSGERTSVIFARGRERTVLDGNAKIISKSTELQADHIEVFGEDFRFAECEGNVVVNNREEEYRLKTERLFFDRELEIVRGQGLTVMEDFKNEIVVKGEYLEHRNTENRSEVQIGVRILGEDINARSEILRYDRTTKQLELTGLPFVIWQGNQYQGARIIVNLDDETVDIQGEVLGNIDIEEEEEEEETASPFPSDSADEETQSFPAPLPEASDDVTTDINTDQTTPPIGEELKEQ